MAGLPRAEAAVMAASVVATADQIIKGIQDSRENDSDEATDHYVKAAIAGAIAIGAYEMMKRDEAHASGHSDHGDHGDHGDHHVSFEKQHHEHAHKHHDPPHPHKGDHHEHDGHKKDLMAEALAAYSLGRQKMGHKDHWILKLAAEALGGAALVKEVDNEVVDKDVAEKDVVRKVHIT